MRRGFLAFSLRGVLAFMAFGATFPLVGCGGSDASATQPATEEAGRFNRLQKLGAMNTKEMIAAKKKEALANRPKNKGITRR